MLGLLLARFEKCGWDWGLLDLLLALLPLLLTLLSLLLALLSLLLPLLTLLTLLLTALYQGCWDRLDIRPQSNGWWDVDADTRVL